ncbi:hypothetical protein BTZ20_4478 [Rhodococcus sp. MTM3W5.2]|uniref:hypothetical protein n=1 Tax=Rhodococcus sp. MTM3W5.2 TaxID=1805827 RepID=UPI0009793EF0|nr:hypothetical protein [Rhodococcus sp. MTM3W5.2]AQA21686.1 hypothetical protein BTZ20_4478 [Rhodococcus sp. MTM3W5.2]
MAATAGDEGQNRTNREEGADSLTTLSIAELIGPDWSYLDDPSRECLTVLHAEGIRLDLMRYLAANSAVNRRAELAVI